MPKRRESQLQSRISLSDEKIKELTKPYTLVDVERSKNNNEGSSNFKTGEGILVWAKEFGSIYWPAIIVNLADIPVEPEPSISSSTFPPTPPSSYNNNSIPLATIMFLEEKWRHTVLTWDRLIPVSEEFIDDQIILLVNKNKLESKKQNGGYNPAFKRSLDLLKEFCTYQQNDRRSKAEEKYKEFQQLQKQKKRKSILSEGSSTAAKRKSKAEIDAKQEEIESKKKHKLLLKRRQSLGYSLRTPPQPVPKPKTPVPTSSTTTNGKHGSDSKVTSSSTTATSVQDLKVESSVTEEKKKDGRPKGGDPLKEWTSSRFYQIDKTFRHESHNYVICSDAKCGQKINIAEGESPVYCHDFPFHQKCTTEIEICNGDTDSKIMKKCEDCISKHCFLCKSSVGDEHILKCSKCELKYHISCLKGFPQAEIQSQSGPITCPFHCCHTCKAEHEIMKKVRNYKVSKGNSLRCIKCPTAYHRFCLPACSMSTVMAKDFIICPRHQDFELGNTVKRLGCFMCNKRLGIKKKGGPLPQVNCVKCPLSYHLNCVADDKIFEGNPNSLEEYRKTFECEACFWGLYPLPGQAVWYAQGRFSFWPARILYPKEASSRSAISSSFGSHSFSISYFGTQQFYDEARCIRTTPYAIAAYDVLQKIKVCTDEPKLMTAYEEGTFYMDLSDTHRFAILPDPEPIYKKIEKNVYKTGTGASRNPKTNNKLRGSNKRNIEQIEMESHNCNCHDDKDAKEICTVSSGCINRDQAIECDDTTCGDSVRCSNRMFSRPAKYLERLEAFVTKKKGWGVKNVVEIKKGEFIVEYCGEVISKELYQWRLGRKVSNDAHYFLELDKKTGNFIDAEYLGNISRLINHSCQPNSCIEKYISGGKKVVGIFAKRDIPPLTELTFDYAYEMTTSNGGDPKSFNCCCGAVNCRGSIDGKHMRNNQVGRSETSPSEIKGDEEWKEHCEICRFPGESLLCCEAPDCQKVYHNKCVGLNAIPCGVWTCPEHKDLKDMKKRSKSIKRKAGTTKGRQNPRSSSTGKSKKPKLTGIKGATNNKLVKNKNNIDGIKKEKDSENKDPYAF